MADSKQSKREIEEKMNTFFDTDIRWSDLKQKDLEKVLMLFGNPAKIAACYAKDRFQHVLGEVLGNAVDRWFSD